MSSILVPLKDGGITSINTNDYGRSGCETCDYGSEYVNEIDFIVTTGKVSVKASMMYEYPISSIVSVSDIILMFVKKEDELKEIREDQLGKWFKEQIVNKVKEDYLGGQDLVISIKNIGKSDWEGE